MIPSFTSYEKIGSHIGYPVDLSNSLGLLGLLPFNTSTVLSTYNDVTKSSCHSEFFILCMH